MSKWKSFDGRVSMVVAPSLLLIEGQFRPLCLTNHPRAHLVKDGDDLAFVAMEIGTIKYDGVRTVALYDYGIPITNSAANAAKP